MKIRAKGKKKAEILVYEDIGEGWLGGISAKTFAENLQALRPLDEINVRINSDGGSVFEGIAMYNTLRRMALQDGAKIIVDIDGLAASIASVFAMAGDEIRIAANGTLMIHNPWGMFAGDADQLREQADLLDQVRGQLIDTYERQASISRDEISELMNKETWMTADQALEFGFVHSITDELQIAAHWDLKRFKHPPEYLQNMKNVLQQEATEQTLQDASVMMGQMESAVAAIE